MMNYFHFRDREQRDAKLGLEDNQGRHRNISRTDYLDKNKALHDVDEDKGHHNIHND